MIGGAEGVDKGGKMDGVEGNSLSLSLTGGGRGKCGRVGRGPVEGDAF